MGDILSLIVGTLNNIKSLILYLSSTMDPLSDIIALLRPRTVLSKPISGRGRWGVRYAAYGLPGFSIVLAGRCWLTVQGQAPLLMERGDFLLFPATPAFTLASDPDVTGTLVEPTTMAVRHGEAEGAPDFEAMGGSFHIEPANAALLLGLLPALVHVRAAEADTTRLADLIRLIKSEFTAERSGRERVLERLLEVLLIEALRWRSLEGGDAAIGLLAGMRDPAIAHALRALHADVRHRWTVEGLAEKARLSRSAFAKRFTETVGCAPMEYLARWRMSLAQDALHRGGTTLERIADQIGYESGSAFSTAFRKRMGAAPRAFARRARTAHDAAAIS